jgi:signal transduction histidine kinase
VSSKPDATVRVEFSFSVIMMILSPLLPRFFLYQYTVKTSIDVYWIATKSLYYLVFFPIFSLSLAYMTGLLSLSLSSRCVAVLERRRKICCVFLATGLSTSTTEEDAEKEEDDEDDDEQEEEEAAEAERHRERI